MLSTFYRHEAESDLGEGMAYFEFVENRPTRQIEVYQSGAVRWGDSEHSDFLGDQSLRFSVYMRVTKLRGRSSRPSGKQGPKSRIRLDSMVAQGPLTGCSQEVAFKVIVP